MNFLKWLIVFLCWLLVWGILMKCLPVNDTSYVNWVVWKHSKWLTLDYYQNKYERFETIDALLNEDFYYLEKLNTWNMVQSAVKAYVDATDDPYTVYMDAEENSGFMNNLEWEDHFVGIWAVVSKKDYYILIEEVLKNTPAYKAWIKPLDRVVMIDWEYVKDNTLNEAVSKIKWEVWTKVTLLIERIVDDESEIFEIDVDREVIDVPSVTTDIFNLWDKKIWYIEISLIWEETEKILKNEIVELKNEWIDGIILDLRWNGWWYLDVWVKVASHFIPKGQLIVEARYKSSSNVSYYSKWFWDLEWIKTVVLVDWLTASAWEIIALALQQQIWAKLIWTTTFWKWTIQAILPFDDWDSLKYTVWARYPPNEINIDWIGVTPDIIIEFDSSAYVNDDIDNQLEEAKNLFN